MASGTEDVSLIWSNTSLRVTPLSRTPQLFGDKILLPQSALQELLDAAPAVQQNSWRLDRQLPHPLIFCLTNPKNGLEVYTGIREFSAEEGEIALSSYIRDALGLVEASQEEDTSMRNSENKPGQKLEVRYKPLPKGTFVKLRPLEAGYDVEDWKALLEQYLRANFTTLTRGQTLIIPGARSARGKREEFRLLIDEMQPSIGAICIIDTDLELDIEALDEEQARETLRRIAAKVHKAPGTTEGSSAGGELAYLKEAQGQVRPGEYVDYKLNSWDRSQGLEIELSGVDDDAEVDVLVNPFSTRQRARPREDEYVFGELASRYPKRIRLQPTNAELDNVEALYISVHSYANPEDSDPAAQTPVPYRLRAVPYDSEAIINGSSEKEDQPHDPDDVQCKNCRQWVPKRTLMLHENFCLRNNVSCPHGCGTVFKKGSPEAQSHWHCPHDTFYGNTSLSERKHNDLYHTEVQCPSCDLTFPNTPLLSQHRTTECSGKIILCQFCHLEVPQEGDPTAPPDPQVILSGLTPHEIADGGRTTDCHLCTKIIRLRDMTTHLKSHQYERLSRLAPQVCRNMNCGRTLDGVQGGDTRAGTKKGQGAGNDLGLCSVCYGPLYVNTYDPDYKAMKRRIERRYLTQLMTGCGKPFCHNPYCKSGRKNNGGEDKAVPMKEGIPMVKPILEKLLERDEKGEFNSPLHFCTDEASQKRRAMAEMLSAEPSLDGKGGWALEWCVGACESAGLHMERSREWLRDYAPQRAEVGG